MIGFRWTVLAVWLVGLPIGLYLGFVTRPTYGLQGLWIGLIIGMALLAFVLVLQVLMLDWEKEARKAEFRLRTRGAANSLDLEENVVHAEGAHSSVDIELGAGGGDEPGIVMNPMGISSRNQNVQNVSRLGSGYSRVIALPAVGSRAVGELLKAFIT